MKKFSYLFLVIGLINLAHSSSEELVYFWTNKNGEIIHDYPVKITDLKDEPCDLQCNYSENKEYILHMSAKNGGEMLFPERAVERKKQANKLMEKICNNADFLTKTRKDESCHQEITSDTDRDEIQDETDFHFYVNTDIPSENIIHLNTRKNVIEL